MIKLVIGGGGLAGLIASWARGRPDVGTVAEPLYGSGARYLYFTVKNRSSSAIRVTIKVKPPLFRLMRGQTEADGIQALSDEPPDPSAFIEPEETRRFPVVGLGDVVGENRENRCGIVVSWRSLRRGNIPQIPVTYPTTVRELQEREKGG